MASGWVPCVSYAYNSLPKSKYYEYYTCILTWQGKLVGSGQPVTGILVVKKMQHCMMQHVILRHVTTTSFKTFTVPTGCQAVSTG